MLMLEQLVYMHQYLDYTIHDRIVPSGMSLRQVFRGPESTDDVSSRTRNTN